MNLTLVVVIAVLAVIGTWYFTKKAADAKVGKYRGLEDAIKLQSATLEQTKSDLTRGQRALSELEGSLKSKQDELQDLNSETTKASERNKAAIATRAESESALQVLQEHKTSVEQTILAESEKLHKVRAEYESVSNDTAALQALKGQEVVLLESIRVKKTELVRLERDILQVGERITTSSVQLHDLISKIDLYSRVEEFVDNGFYEMPDYLFETSDRYTVEISRVRQKQKALINAGEAITVPLSVQITADGARDKKILDGQIKLMLTAFNIECDFLIEKVNPSSYVRTLDRIEKLANVMEKNAVTLHCGFNLSYVELKFEECTLQYQFSLKRQEEQDEQRLIREQIREEQKVIREYEAAIAQSEKEERIYREMLLKARADLSNASAEEKAMADLRILELESLLQDAEQRNERAKSMAEQTRKGHVYVISNVGSFGEDVYKIGLTRRLDPMDRVKELGDASVPFRFDVHAMIYVDDAPLLETALHREFSRQRVNAVNMRKEFFRVDLEDVKRAVEKIAGLDADFKTTALAEEYYESKRLQSTLRPVEYA
ncbi:DUF4041 domain-containing protein [Iodobacter sp. LRB]|uniref:DUF4041 domain-containing protein n=1 Tax=unclassified Iodobacter TaxID=235634 RepID=UPI000C109F80|nr:DUF4041 domain-containing protein [Iodobacter sp. BJB302]PHV00448.1 ATPase [Iodobacter sp. BJB302]